MRKLIRVYTENLSRYTIALISVGIVIVFWFLTKGLILKPMNITNLIIQNAYIIIIGVGMMLLIKAGGMIDLSVGALCALVGGLCGMWMIALHMNTYLALLLAALAALAVGVWNGFLVAKIQINAFIATMATQLIVRGLLYVILQGKSYTMFPSNFTSWCTGFLPDVFGGNGIHITTLVVGAALSAVVVFLQFRARREKIKYEFEVCSTPFFILLQLLIVAFIMVIAYALSVHKGIPKVLVLVGIIVIAYSFVMSKTVIGRHIIAVGSNRQAAVLSGVKDERVIFGIYVNSALLAAFAGIIYAARLNGCSCNVGIGFETDAIAVCFIGGGVTNGSVIGAVLGALIIGLLNNGMSILGIAADVQMCIKGFVLVAAVTLDILQSRKSR